jgi:hypothetical protein
VALTPLPCFEPGRRPKDAANSDCVPRPDGSVVGANSGGLAFVVDEGGDRLSEAVGSAFRNARLFPNLAPLLAKVVRVSTRARQREDHRLLTEIAPTATLPKHFDREAGDRHDASAGGRPRIVNALKAFAGDPNHVAVDCKCAGSLVIVDLPQCKQLRSRSLRTHRAVQGHCSQRNRFASALARLTPTHFPFVKLN